MWTQYISHQSGSQLMLVNSSWCWRIGALRLYINLIVNWIVVLNYQRKQMQAMKWSDWPFLIMKSQSHGQKLHFINLQSTDQHARYPILHDLLRSPVLFLLHLDANRQRNAALPAQQRRPPSSCVAAVWGTQVFVLISYWRNYIHILYHYSISQIQLWDNCFYLCEHKIKSSKALLMLQRPVSKKKWSFFLTCLYNSTRL